MTGRILGLSFVLLAATLAHAQQVSPLEPPDLERYLRWGPLRVRPAIEIPTLGYDSNVFYRNAGSSQPEVGDYFIAIAPRLPGLVLFGHRAFLTFDEQLQFFLYAREHSIDYYNQLGKARLTVPFSRFGLYADFGYDRIRDRPIDAQDQRPIRVESPVGGGVIVKFGWRTDAEIGFTRTRATASDPDEVLNCTPGVTPGCFSIGQRNDRTDTGTRLLVRYLVFGRMRVVLQALRRNVTFDDAAIGRDGSERRILPGLDFGLGGRLSGTLHVGYDRFDLKDPSKTGYSGTIADAALYYRLGGLGSSLSLKAVRDVRYTTYFNVPLYRYTSARLTFVKYFNRFLGMEAAAGQGRVVFIGDTTGRADLYRTGSLGVRFRVSETELGRRVEYAFRYVRTDLTSNCDAPPLNCSYVDSNRGTIGFGVVYGY